MLTYTKNFELEMETVICTRSVHAELLFDDFLFL
jgi:hypothetical protein